MGMKCCLFIFLLSVLSAMGQDDPFKARFGVKAGFNYSYIDFSKGSPSLEVPMETSWSNGFHAGVVVVIPVSQRFFFQPEYLFSYISSEIRPTQNVYRLSYLTLPVLLRLETGSSFSFVAGPQFGLLINAEEVVKSASRNLTKDIENRSIEGAVGMEYEVANVFSIHLRYVRGLNHIGIRYQDNAPVFKYEMIQSSIIITF